MATTRIMPLHVGKGRTESRATVSYTHLDVYKRQLQMDAAVPDSTITQKQAELNRLYDSFSARYLSLIHISALPGCGSWRSAIWIPCRPCLSAPMMFPVMTLPDSSRR